jgi:hypothetical protein
MEDPGNIYHGNCQCGGYRFNVRLAPHERLELVACDCRLCEKQGYLWYMPLVANVEVIRDDGNLVEYRSTTLEHKVIIVLSLCYGRNMASCGFTNAKKLVLWDLRHRGSRRAF